MTESAARRLVGDGRTQELDALIASAKRRDFKPVPLGDQDVDRGFDVKLENTETANVIGAAGPAADAASSPPRR